MTLDPMHALNAVAAALLGAIGAWLILRRRTGGEPGRLDGFAPNDLVQLQIDLASAETRIRGLEEDKAALVASIDAAKSETRQLSADVSVLRDERAQLRERAARLTQAESDLTSKTDALNEANQSLASLESEVRQLRLASEKYAALERAQINAQSQIAELREQSGRVEAEFKAEHELSTGLRATLQAEKNKLDALLAQFNALTSELAETRTRLDAERSAGQEKLALLSEAKQALTDQFRVLANEILDEKSKRFTELNQLNLGQLLDPLKSRLTEFQAKVEDVYIKEGKDRSALAEQVRQLFELNQNLSEDAKNLTRALKGSSKAQGNWGELVLERVLEASGLRKGEEYIVQDSVTRDDGTRSVPDVVIRLPEERNLIVDAKVSLTAYEEGVNAETDAEREAALRRHLDSVRAHIRTLSDRNYQSLYGIRSLDFVLMFVPVEPAFMVAVTSDIELFMDAWRRNVLLVSPSTLLFVVRTVAHLWRQEAQNKNAQEIAKRGGDLYDKLVGFVESLTAIGTRLQQAQKEYDDAYGRLAGGRGNLIWQAEKLKELGVRPTKSLPSVVVDGATTADEQPILPR